MTEETNFSKRLTALRQAKGASARDMSLSLGQSESYINKIENNKALPSMTGFFYICDYFGITPKEFFDYDIESPATSNELLKEIQKLSKNESEHILEVIKDVNKKK